MTRKTQLLVTFLMTQRSHSFRIGLLACSLVIFIPTSGVKADTVITTSGKKLVGQAKWVASGLEIRAAGAPAGVIIPIAEIASASFDPPAVAKTPAASTRPVDWTSYDIGSKSQPGRATVGRGAEDAGLITLFDSTVVNWKKRGMDNLFFLGQKVRGDLTLIARLRTVEESHGARAGLMVRSSEAVDSPMALIGRGPEGESVLVRRSVDKSEAEEIARSTHRIMGATWLRLVRQGNTFTAHESLDAKTWTSIGSCEIAMEEEVYVGLSTQSGKTGREGRTVFDNLTLTANATAAAAQRTPRGLLTRSGSFLAGDVTEINETKVRITLADGSAKEIATADVARCILNPLLPAQDEKLRTLDTGVMLINGDYLAGEIKGLTDRRVRVTSVLFGLKTIDTGREACAVILKPADAVPAACAFEVALADHSVLHAKSINPANGSVTIVDTVIGERVAKGEEVREIKRAAARK